MYIAKLITELNKNGVIYVDGLDSRELNNIKNKLHEQNIKYEYDICGSRIIKK